ncbi:hypothetical protein L218DRAFT_1080704 [Marasmius fiardii PR-910]|nr:hypothetical protein L218DRAFT_1080704 [Marasmius fiardii PR-910]
MSAQTGLNAEASNNSGNSSSTHGPFPILSFGGETMDRNQFFNHPSMYQPAFTGIIPSTSSSTAGTWLANLKLHILSHRHADGTPCSNVLEHAVNADSEEDPSFVAAHTKLIQHILQPEKDKCTRLETELESLRRDRDRIQKLYDEAKVHIVTPPPSSSVAGSKRKPDHQDNPDRRRPPPTQKPRSSASSRMPYELVSYSSLGPAPFPSTAAMYTLCQHIKFRPGNDLSQLQFTFSDVGGLVPSPYIVNCARMRNEPDILSFPAGSMTGNQTPPDRLSELADLIELSGNEGNLVSLSRIRDSMGLAQILNEVISGCHLPTVLLPSPYHRLLSVNPDPNWSTFTRFWSPRDCINTPTDNEESWNDAPTAIPAIRTPGPTSTDCEHALFIFVHYDNKGHMGIIITNGGTIDLDSVVAYRIFTGTLPANRQDSIDYRVSFVRVAAWPGLYEHVLRVKNIAVNIDGHVTRCPPDLMRDTVGVVRHLADCGISVSRMNTMQHWALQYCIDTQQATHLPTHRREEYAHIYKFARLRSLFFPIPSLRPERTFTIPLHISRQSVLEYRRRHTVYGLLKSQGRLTEGYRLPTTPVPLYPSTALPLDITKLNIDRAPESDIASNTTVSSSPNLGTSTVASSSIDTQNAASNTITTGSSESSAQATQGSSAGRTTPAPQTGDQDVTMHDSNSSLNGILPGYGAMEH